MGDGSEHYPFSFLNGAELPYFFRRPLLMGMALLVTAVGALSFWRGESQRAPSDEAGSSYGPALVVGRVIGFPRSVRGGEVFQVRAQWVRCGSARAQRSTEKISVFRSIPSNSPGLEAFTWGDRVSLWGTLRAGRMFVPADKALRIGRLSSWNPLRWAVATRTRVRDCFQRHLTSQQAQLMCGVLIGDRPARDHPMLLDFRRSGTLHLLVASGTNVGFALGVWWLAARWMLWWPPRWILAAAPGVAFFYAVVAGAEAPVIRAALMSVIACGCYGLGRWDRPVHGLFLSAAAILAVRPSSLTEAGFQMSYAAALAIGCYWDNRFGNDEKKDVPKSRWRRMGGWVWDLSASSFWAQMALAPLLVYYFGRFSWIGIISNVVAVPLAGVCLWAGTVLAFLDSIWPWAARVFAVPAGRCADSLAGWAHVCAQVPWAECRFYFSLAQVIVAGSTIGIGLVLLHYVHRWWSIPTVAVLGAGICLWLRPNGDPTDVRVTWGPGRQPSVWVHSGPLAKSHYPDGKHTLLDMAQRHAPGEEWVEGSVHFHLFRPEGGEGTAVLAEMNSTKSFFAWGLSRVQQKAVGPQVPTVDIVFWQSGGGADAPTIDFMTALNPRRTLYAGSRIPRSVRLRGGRVFYPSQTARAWMTEANTFAGLAEDIW